MLDEDEVERLSKLIQTTREPGNARFFEQLTALGSIESFEAASRLRKSVQRPDVMVKAFVAFENYAGVSGVEKGAIKWLTEQCAGGSNFYRQAAIQGLVRFGSAATDELEVIVKRSKDPVVRAWALGPLLPGLQQESSPEAIRTIAENAEFGYTAPAEKMLEVLSSFVGPDNDEAFCKTLKSKKVPSLNKAVVIETIATRKGNAIDKALLSALKSKETVVQLAAMKALDSRGSTAQVSTLKKLVKSKDDAVRRQAIISMGLIRGGESEWLKDLAGMVRSKDPATRMGSACALAEIRTPEALELLYPLLNDGDHLVQFEALQQISNLRRKETLPVLIARINGARGRLNMQLLVNLRLITGEDHGSSSDRWMNWWKGVEETFEIPSYDDALAAENDRDRRRSESKTVSTFYGLKIVSDRICFIMDTSGSMREPGGKGDGNRLKAAKDQLVGVLESYPDGDLFNLIFFSSDAFGWEDELVRMTDDSREEALEYVSRQRPDGATAIYDALKLAFEDRRIDTLYLLTDGDPMGGTIDNPARIRQEVAAWNEARHIRINCIAIGKPSPLLQDLARDTGGTYKEE